jgi:hypothetical protein
MLAIHELRSDKRFGVSLPHIRCRIGWNIQSLNRVLLGSTCTLETPLIMHDFEKPGGIDPLAFAVIMMPTTRTYTQIFPVMAT